MASADDDEPCVPRAGLNKIIKEVLPTLRVGVETREAIHSCCTEFVHILTGHANELCERQQRRTITPEHILKALDELGFGSYVEDAKKTAADCKEQETAKRKRTQSKWDKSGKTEEELYHMQQELFDAAKREQAAADLAQWQRTRQQMSTSSDLIDDAVDEDDEYV